MPEYATLATSFGSTHFVSGFRNRRGGLIVTSLLSRRRSMSRMPGESDDQLEYMKISAFSVFVTGFV